MAMHQQGPDAADEGRHVAQHRPRDRLGTEQAGATAAIEGVLKETRRFEELTRGTRALRISAAYDGLEIDV